MHIAATEISLTFFRYLASWTPKQQLVVVLPTPPFPPTKTHWRVSWSMIFWRLGSGSSDSSNSVVMLSRVFVLLAVGFFQENGWGNESKRERLRFTDPLVTLLPDITVHIWCLLFPMPSFMYEVDRCSCTFLISWPLKSCGYPLSGETWGKDVKW